MTTTTIPADPTVRRARNAVGLSFALNGFLFASLVSRIPDLRSRLDLGNGDLGLLLLAIAAGSVLALPSTGRLIERWSPGAVLRAGALVDGTGLLLAACGAFWLESVPVAAVGLFVHGVGIGVWDVSMNVEAAEVERRLARTVMPRFHAGFSLGTIGGAVLGIPMSGLGVAMPVHLGAVVVVAVVLAVRGASAFLPPEAPSARGEGRPRTAWSEPRTLALGVMVLAFAMVEGTANDWLALALIDGHDVPRWLGVAGFATFVTAMTAGRLLGTSLLDRFGRSRVLWASAAAAGAGTLLTVLAEPLPLVALGIVVWGLGASLGFPVGMSAAADDPARAAARVSVVSTIGYGAFLAGPPLVGQLADVVGTLHSLLVVAVLMVPAAVAVLATRERAV